MLAALAVVATGCGLTPSDPEPLAGSEDGPACEPVSPPAPDQLDVGTVVEDPEAEADHLLCEVQYEKRPPTAGAHFPAWQNCGWYDQAVRDETAVHSLEHGAVWVAYGDDASEADRATLRALAATESYLLVTPYPDLKNPLVLTAWQRQLAVDSWADPAVAKFLADQLGDVSQTAPEAGASCAGRIGTPGGDPDTLYAEALESFLAQ